MSRRYACDEPDTRARGLQEAASAVRRGELVVLPTDTLYGLGTDAFSPAAVRSLYTARGRPYGVPVPVFVGSPTTLHGLVSQMPESGWDLVDAFWPGPLTIVTRHQPSLQWDLGNSRGTVMLRMPLHPVALELLNLTGPMAVTSASRTTEVLPVSVSPVQDELGTSVEVYLDSGDIQSPGASTIIDLTGDAPRLLREGALTVSNVRRVVSNLSIEM